MVLILQFKLSCFLRHTMNSHYLKNENWSYCVLSKTTMHVKESSEHLVLVRGDSSEVQVNVNGRISLTRRTLYYLIKTGMHDSNGLILKVSFKMYQCYVM